MEKLAESDTVPYFSCGKKSLALVIHREGCKDKNFFSFLSFFLTLFINDDAFGSVAFLLPKQTDRTDFPSSLLDSVLKSHSLLDR